MIEVETGRFTVGVFQDVAWATKGIEALKQAGFPLESLTLLAKDTPDAATLIEKTFASPGDRFELATIGQVLAHGPLIDALQGPTRDFGRLGLAGTMKRV